MASATINLNFRPIKFAHLVDPQNVKAIRSAIHANTMLWGGFFNPIIPDIKRSSKIWNIFNNIPTSGQIVENYISKFDPDILISQKKESTKSFDHNVVYPIINFNDFWQSVQNEMRLGAGISLFEIADHIADTEFKYVRKNPLNCNLPLYNGEFSLFLSAVFGELPQDLMTFFVKRYSNDFSIKQVPCGIDDFFDFLDESNIFLRRITTHDLNATRNSQRVDCGLLLDAKNNLDIIDYMNLRALGWTVIPIPIQTYESKKTIDYFNRFIDENYFPPKDSNGFYRNTTLIKGRSIPIDNFNKIAAFFSSQLKPQTSACPKLVFMGWFPRMWDNEKDNQNEDTPPTISFKKETIDFEEIKDKTSIHLPKLDFSWSSWGNGPKYATEISFRVYGENEIFAEVIPKAPRLLSQAFSFMEPDEWRFSKTGIVHLTQHEDWNIPIKFPKAQEIFTQWLKSKGWEVKISPPGKIAYQMLNYLKGIFGVTIFTTEEILKLLTQPVALKEIPRNKVDEIKNRASKGLSLNEIRTALTKTLNKDKHPFASSVNNIIRRLVEYKVIALGIKVQCQTCSQHSWFSLSEINYSMKCPGCYCDFPLPTHDTTMLSWSYKTIGPFSLPESAYGVYSVLLTLRFLSMTIDLATTPLLSFNAVKNATKPIEADLAVLFREFRFSNSSKTPRILFAECKTYNQFAEKDIKRMELIAKEFPGAILVFATLRRELMKKEKQIIRRIAEKGRKLNDLYKQRNPVLVLTGNELFNTWWPPEEWKTKSDQFIKFANFRGRHDVDSICEISQQLYLEMDSWSDWYEKRRKQKAERQLQISSQLNVKVSNT